MTLVIFLECCNGVVVASDTQSTISGSMKRSGSSKINKINDRVIWAGSGDEAFLYDLEEEINSLKAYNIIRDGMAMQQMKEHISQKIYETFLKYKQKFDKLELDCPQGSIICATFEGDSSCNGLLVNTAGTPYRISTGYEAIGSSKDFAEVLLKGYYINGMSVEEGIRLAHWIIHQCSKTDIFVNENAIIYVIKKNGEDNLLIEEVSEENIEELKAISSSSSEIFKELYHKFQPPELMKILEDASSSHQKTEF